MVIIYGAGMTGKSILKELIKEQRLQNEILFVDSDSKLWGTYVDGIEVLSPNKIKDLNFEKIIVGAAMGREAIFESLTNLGVAPSMIDMNNPFVESYFRCYANRENFMKNYAEIAEYKKLNGSIAEGGVFEGRFSKVLSKVFPNRKLYLFDTFEGFDERDVELDKKNNYSTNIRRGMYSTDKKVDDIVNSLEHPENVIVKKGYFPESASDVADEFLFVNLDFDLYKPTLEGLRFFWPQMVKGGVILVHDYFNAPGIIEEDRYWGIRAAVSEFSDEMQVSFIPIADEMSVAFIK